MALFDNIIPRKSKEQKFQEQAAEKEKDFIRENQMLETVSQNEQLDLANQEGRSDLLKWQQDLNDELERLKHRLRGEYLNRNNQWVTKNILVGKDKYGNKIFEPLTPLANEIFIDDIENQVEPFLSRNMFSSNFTEKRILEMLKYTCDDISDAMADGWDKYEIEFTNYDIIMRLVKNVIIPGPFRAMNDGQRRHDRTVAKRIEAFNERDQPIKKKTLLGFK